MLCLVTQSCLTFCNPVDCSPPGSCPWGFSRQEYWSGLPCSPPADLPNPEIEPKSPTLQVDSLPSEPPGKPIIIWKWKWLSHVWLCNPLDYCIFHGIHQAKILEWVAVSFSRGSSQPRDRTQVSRIGGRLCTNWATREAPIIIWLGPKFFFFFPSPVDEYGSLTIAMCCSLVEAVCGPSPLTSILCMWPAPASRMFPAGCPVDAEVWESSLALSLLFSFCSRLRWGFHHYLRFQNEKDIEQSQSQPITFISVSEVMKVGCCKPLGFEGHLSLGHHLMETNHSTDDTWDLHPGILAPDQHSPSLLWELHVSYSAVNCPLPHTGTSDSKYLKGKPSFSGLGWLLCLHSESCILVGNTTTYPFTHATYLGHILENNVFTL